MPSVAMRQDSSRGALTIQSEFCRENPPGDSCTIAHSCEFSAYGSIPGVQTLTDAQIQQYTAKIINLELKLAGSTYSTDDTTRRIYSHFVNWYTVAGTARPSATAQIPFIDWATYVTVIF